MKGLQVTGLHVLRDEILPFHDNSNILATNKEVKSMFMSYYVTFEMRSHLSSSLEITAPAKP